MKIRLSAFTALIAAVLIVAYFLADHRCAAASADKTHSSAFQGGLGGDFCWLLPG